MEFLEKRQAMDVPAGGPLKGDNLKGKHMQGHCSRGQKAGISAEDGRQKALHTFKTSASRTFRRSMPQGIHLNLDANRNPLITYPILPPPSFLEVPLLPARYKQMSGHETRRSRERNVLVSQPGSRLGLPLMGGCPMNLGAHRSRTAERNFTRG